MRLWSSATGALVARVEGLDGMDSVPWSPDGTHIASVTDNGTVVIRSTNGEPVTTLRLDPAREVALGPTGGIAVRWADRIGVLDLRERR